MTLVFAPVAFTASATVLKIGTVPSNFWPPFPGVTPATSCVPYSIICFAWNEPSRPVIPCTSSLVFLSMKTLMLLAPLGELDSLLHRLVHVARRREAVLLQDLHRDLFVGACQTDHNGDFERIRLRRGHDAVRDVIGAG